METIQLYEIMESDQAKNFWQDLENESTMKIEFLDAAICFAVVRNLARTHSRDKVS